MADDSKSLLDLQTKLGRLEESLKNMLNAAEADIALAAEIQKKLFKDRLPNIPGLRCFSRYISSYGVSAEGFEVFATNKGRDVWIIGYWTETFGLSSLLMQTLVHVQSQVTVGAGEQPPPIETLFNDLSISLSEARKQARYRLTLARLDTHTLKLTSLSAGALPLFLRGQKGRAWQAPTFLGQLSAERAEPANSAAPVTADRALRCETTIPPGSRVYYFGNSWTAAVTKNESDLNAAAEALRFADMAPDAGPIDDLNHLFLAAQGGLDRAGAKADLCGVALEIQAGKLHLA